MQLKDDKYPWTTSKFFVTRRMSMRRELVLVSPSSGRPQRQPTTPSSPSKVMCGPLAFCSLNSSPTVAYLTLVSGTSSLCVCLSKSEYICITSLKISFVIYTSQPHIPCKTGLVWGICKCSIDDLSIGSSGLLFSCLGTVAQKSSDLFLWTQFREHDSSL